MDANILATEYSELFDELRKGKMELSFYKYGPIKANYGTDKFIPALELARKCIDKYLGTGNQEYLVDAANYMMIEFMCPSIKANYQETDNSGSVLEEAGYGGWSTTELQFYEREHWDEDRGYCSGWNYGKRGSWKW